MVRAERDGVDLRDAKETIGNIVMTAWKMVHKHPDIRSAWLLPLASLSDGLNSFLFSGGSCLAATSCLGCLQCLFVVTWNTCEKSSGPRVTRAQHEGKAHQFITAWRCFILLTIWWWLCTPPPCLFENWGLGSSVFFYYYCYYCYCDLDSWCQIKQAWELNQIETEKIILNCN